MNPWVEATRPKTLPAAVAPVLVGTAAASAFILWRFVAAMLVAVALQIAVNFANDYSDAKRGVDTDERVGPRRMVASGMIEPGQMKVGIGVALGFAAVIGLGLASAVGWWLVLVGLVSGLAALGYSGGPRPYASAGLGEVFVFVFFGLVATVGSQYVQDEAFSSVALVASLGVGGLAVALLLVNNLRDIPTDTKADKHTLAVRLGDRRTRTLYSGIVVVSVLNAAVVAQAAGSPWPLLALLAGVPAWAGISHVQAGAEGSDLIEVLEATARTHLLYGALLALGLVVGS